MKKLNNLLKSCRLVSIIVKQHSPIVCTTRYRSDSFLLTTPYCYVNTRRMAQKSITSFFKITPKKPERKDSEDKTSPHNDSSVTEESIEKEESAPEPKRSSKRLRSESVEDESPKASKRTSPLSSGKKKKAKRQRIESSESEPESSAKQDSPEVKSEEKTFVKLENNVTKTYASPKSRKAKEKQKMKEESSPIKKDKIKIEKNCRNSSTDDEIGEEKDTTVNKNNTKRNEKKSSSPVDDVKENSSPIHEKKNGHGEASRSPSPIIKEEKKESPPKKKNPFEAMKVKSASANGEDVKQNVEEGEDSSGLAPETDYDPAKAKYHPIKDACWAKDQPVPYLALAKTLEAIEATSARLKMVEILSNYFRSVIVLTPEDLLPSIYLCLNQLAPAYHSLELGMAETYLLKAVGGSTGRSVAQVRAAARRCGDLGRAAEAARATQRTLARPRPLSVRGVYGALCGVARLAGAASVAKKIAAVQALYVACRHSEARYLIRSLEGKLRVGLAEQSVLQALALAAARSPAAGPHAGELDVAAAMSPDAFKAMYEQYALTVKTTYCECPNYEALVPALLRHGARALPEHCRLRPGVPLKPMLAHPTRGVHEVFDRFENTQFTCEYKYDGERAQIHVPGDRAPDLAGAKLFSRNQEDNTSKYPDVLGRLPALLGPEVTSCVLDCEAVAYDTAADQILPFQVLSTRKRKDAQVQQITVQVCVFVFDLLYLNGRALVREPFAERRRLLRDHFREKRGEWQFACSRDCSSTEEVQQFLDEAVRDSCEGLMVKTLAGDSARYDIARRSRNWLKLKKDYLEGVGDTIDAVVIGAYLGRGKRAGVYGGFLLACWEPHAEEYQSLCKIGTGFSEDDLRTLTDQLRVHRIDAPPNYYRYDASHAAEEWFAARCVWEVRCADLSLSPAHRAAAGLLRAARGVSLRFPRFVRARADKTGEQATTAQQIADMYRAQAHVRALPAQHHDDDDFY